MIYNTRLDFSAVLIRPNSIQMDRIVDDMQTKLYYNVNWQLLFVRSCDYHPA